MPGSVLIHLWESQLKPLFWIHFDFVGLYLGEMFLISTDIFSK